MWKVTMQCTFWEFSVPWVWNRSIIVYRGYIFWTFTIVEASILYAANLKGNVNVMFFFFFFFIPNFGFYAWKLRIRVELSKSIYSYRCGRNDNRAIKSVAHNETSLLKCLVPWVLFKFVQKCYVYHFQNWINISTF